FKITADDGNEGESIQQFTLIAAENSPPMIVEAPEQVVGVAEVSATYSLDAADFNDEVLTLKVLDINGNTITSASTSGVASNDPADPTTITFSYEPPAQGIYDLRLVVSDEHGATSEQPLRVIAADPLGDSPVLMADFNPPSVIAPG